MSQFQQKVEILRREQITRDIIRLAFHAPVIAEASRPGQFVMVRVADGYDPLLRRPFSIHRVGRDGALQILFKVVGRGTDCLAQLRIGEKVEILGPLGSGFRLQAQGEACLVGGGMGIAPLLFLADWSVRLGMSVKRTRVILGARNRQELEPFVEDFQKLGLEVLAATDDGSLGHHGLVTDIVRQLQLGADGTVYSCGPKPMLTALSLLCHSLAVPCQVSMETIMACGMGACLGCAVPIRAGGYAHVCSDGPVFDAEELLWSL